MAIEYKFRQDSDILKVRVFGKNNTLPQVKDFIMQMLATNVATGCHKVLCDLTELEYTPETIDVFESAKFYTDIARSDTVVALLIKSEQADPAVFWETVANNRGLNVKTFTDVSEAEVWLKKP
jgi:hypothetical protein